MEKGLNFRTRKGQEDYFEAYDKTLKLWNIPYREQYLETSFGKTHCLICGEGNTEALVLLHAASCGATIWYPNVASLSQRYCIYAIDLITESSKSILLSRIKTAKQCAKWLNETIEGLNLDQVYFCGLSIGGWHAANYALTYPEKVKKLILLSPIQTLARMHLSFFFKIMRMGFHPTRENVERYIGWGSSNEAPLPDSIIEQFTISVLNVNPNNAFPRMIRKRSLKSLDMPVLVILGKKEFSFDIKKAEFVAKATISDLKIAIIKEGSHLISVSLPNEINEKIKLFLNDDI